ncbi:MAG: hypothetical protein R2828_19825 [Saprospiraceae bacterium]
MSILKGLSIRSLWLFCMALFLGACQIDQGFTDIEVPVEEEEEVIAAYPGVEEALWVYFDRFEKEGVLRGLEIDLREAAVTGLIKEIEEDGVAGQCSYGSHQSNHVAIDKQFWDQASDLLREFVVFHELGHCNLGRDHREAAKADGTCESIMASGVGDCRDNYKSITREAYLDELFDPSFGGEIF